MDLLLNHNLKAGSLQTCLKSVTALLFQNTDSSVRLPGHSIHWGLIRGTRCARTLYLSTFLPPLEVLLVGF